MIKTYEQVKIENQKPQNTTIYRCPFCQAENWFNHKHKLAKHLYTDHLRETLDECARQNKTGVSKRFGKWFVTP